MRNRFYVAIVAAAAVVALADPSASAAGHAIAASKSTAQCPGGTLLTAVSERRLPAGAIAYTYDLPGGRSFENIAPPAGFSVTTASNALLTELNLPQRPSAAVARKGWQAQVEPFGKSDISGAEKFCTGTTTTEPAPPPVVAGSGTANGTASPLASLGHTGSTIWSGYELRDGSYEKVVGHFTQPLVSTNSNDAMFNWIGLNGSGSNGRLLQAGTENSPGSTVGEPFWEEYCGAVPNDGCNYVQPVGTADAGAGADVSVSVSFNPATDLSYYALAINGTQYINVQYPMESGSNSGVVADFITERPSGRNLPVFTAVDFSGSRTYSIWNSDSSVPFGSQDFYSYELTSNGSFYSAPCSTSANILMFPNDITSGGFVNNFCASS